MNRQLKFRVYSFLDKCFHYFDIYNYPQGIAGAVSDPQQYTGLKDIDNKEIYEGDLVGLHTGANNYAIGVKENHYGLYEIYWDRKYKLKEIKPNWFFKINNGCCAASLYIMKVDGNIFEHKHLLEK